MATTMMVLNVVLATLAMVGVHGGRAQDDGREAEKFKNVRGFHILVEDIKEPPPGIDETILERFVEEELAVRNIPTFDEDEKLRSSEQKPILTLYVNLNSQKATTGYIYGLSVNAYTYMPAPSNPKAWCELTYYEHGMVGMGSDEGVGKDITKGLQKLISKIRIMWIKAQASENKSPIINQASN